MDVVARKVERDKELEHERIGRVGGCEETQETRSRATIGYHVENGSKLACLTKSACGLTVDGIKETRDGVQDGADLGVVGHVDECGAGEDDARVALLLGIRPGL